MYIVHIVHSHVATFRKRKKKKGRKGEEKRNWGRERRRRERRGREVGRMRGKNYMRIFKSKLKKNYNE